MENQTNKNIGFTQNEFLFPEEMNNINIELKDKLNQNSEEPSQNEEKQITLRYKDLTDYISLF